jgi:hypothetical protein
LTIYNPILGNEYYIIINIELIKKLLDILVNYFIGINCKSINNSIICKAEEIIPEEIIPAYLENDRIEYYRSSINKTKYYGIIKKIRKDSLIRVFNDKKIVDIIEKKHIIKKL